jgi:hypothetical protein
MGRPQLTRKIPEKSANSLPFFGDRLMYTKNRLAPTLACLLLVGLAAKSADAQFPKLVQLVPDSANTIILLNAEKVLNSEVALREGWQKNFEKSIEAGVVRLPADTQQYVLAAEIDFEYMQPVWQVGALTSKNKRDMVYLAKTRDGKQDTINGLSAVLMPNANYLVQFEPTIYASLVPGSRQAVARWIAEAKSKEVKLSPYLQEAISYSRDAGTEIIMAMDLSFVLTAEVIGEKLKASPVLSKADIDPVDATKILASLRGAMLGVTLGEKPYGSIKVDFGEDVAPLKDVAVEFLDEVLEDQGAMIDDFRAWKAKTKEKQITLSGTLSSEGMRQIFSLIDAPVANAVTPETESTDTQQSASDQDSVAVASQKYFKSVTQYFRDLRHKEPQRIAQYGIWFDKYARKIDQLPMVNVDQEMLDYGAYVSQQFRNAGAAIKGIGVRSRVRQVEGVNAAGNPAPGVVGGGYYNGAFYHGDYAYRGYSGYQRANWVQEGLRQQQRVRTQVKVQEKAAGTSAARAIMQDLENETAKVRRKMVEKYNVEFEAK